MNDEEIREAVDRISETMPYLKGDAHEKYHQILLDLATAYLEASEQFPKERDESVVVDCGDGDECNVRAVAFNEARSQCLAVHLKKVGELEAMLRMKQDDWLGACKEVDKLKEDNSGLNNTITKLTERMNEMQHENSKLKEDNSCLKENLKHRMEDVATYQATASKLEEENAELKQEIKDRADCESSTAKIVIEDGETIKQLHQQIEGLRADIKKVKNKDSEGGFGTELFV